MASNGKRNGTHVEAPGPDFVQAPALEGKSDYLHGTEHHELIPNPPTRATQVDAVTRRRMCAVWLREYLPRFRAIAQGQPVREERKVWKLQKDGTMELTEHTITERTPTVAEVMQASEQLIGAGLGRRTETLQLQDPGTPAERAMRPVVWAVPTQMPPEVVAQRDDLGAQIAALAGKRPLS